MEKWQEIKEKYTKRLVGQDVEDILARRIWRGLGLAGSVKDIYSVEKQLFGDCMPNDPLYDRVFAIFAYCYRNKYTKFNLHCETLEIKSHNEVLERIPFLYASQVGYSASGKPVYLTKNLNATIAYIIEPDNKQIDYKPPYFFLTR